MVLKRQLLARTIAFGENAHISRHSLFKRRKNNILRIVRSTTIIYNNNCIADVFFFLFVIKLRATRLYETISDCYQSGFITMSHVV